jgi:hypothetical protein
VGADTVRLIKFRSSRVIRAKDRDHADIVLA